MMTLAPIAFDFCMYRADAAVRSVIATVPRTATGLSRRSPRASENAGAGNVRRSALQRLSRACRRSCALTGSSSIPFALAGAHGSTQKIGKGVSQVRVLRLSKNSGSE
jgi:hypothetical protein